MLNGKDQQELKKFLEEQIEWCRWHNGNLKNIEKKLYEMKELAEYARDHELNPIELYRIEEQLNSLKQEVYFFDRQLQPKIN